LYVRHYILFYIRRGVAGKEAYVFAESNSVKLELAPELYGACEKCAQRVTTYDDSIVRIVVKR